MAGEEGGRWQGSSTVTEICVQGQAGVCRCCKGQTLQGAISGLQRETLQSSDGSCPLMAHCPSSLPAL